MRYLLILLLTVSTYSNAAHVHCALPDQSGSYNQIFNYDGEVTVEASYGNPTYYIITLANGSHVEVPVNNCIVTGDLS